MAETSQPIEGKTCSICGATYGMDARFCPIDGTALAVISSSDDPLIGKKLDGRYLILSKIGSGGMGAVYEGVQLAFDRPVAIKIIRDVRTTSTRARQRFWLEAKAVSRLEHNNVVRIYDYGTDHENNPFLVSELLRGRSVAELILQDGLPMAPAEAAAIVFDACKGLSTAHAAGLVHRDIKPSNLWLTSSAIPSEPVVVKLLDFGLVKASEHSSQDLTVGDETVGTPSYMAPEQVEGRSTIDGTADLYALGVVFYELVVGRVPFSADTVTNTLMAHLTQAIPTPSTAINGSPIPGAVQDFWVRAMAKKSSERFKNAAEMMAAISPIMNMPVAVGDGPQQVSEDANVMVAVCAATEPQMRNPMVNGAMISSRSLLSRERKLVTVVTVRAADRPGKPRADLEERLDALDPLMEEWTKAVLSFGGVATPVEAQGIHAVFGLPSAGEDDNCKALRAAFSLSQVGAAIDSDFAVQIGVHTCSVLVQGADDASGGYRIVGEAYDVAEGVAAAGAPDGGMPVLSGSAYRGLQRFLREPIDPTGELQGDPFYVAAHEDVLASREISLDISRPKPFVGRIDEVATLEFWVEHTLSLRQSGFCVVTGEAGVGKSHLLVELGRRIAKRWPDAQYLMAAHDGHGHVPFSLFRAMLLGATGPTAGNATASISRWVSTVLSTHATNFDEARANDVLRLVGLAQGSTDEEAANPQGWQQRVFGIMADLCGSIATRGGLVLLVDDLHDTDPGSIALLQHITRTLSDFPVLVVGFGRPFEKEQLAVNYELTLNPLSQEEARTLASDLLGEGRAVAGLTARILDRAEGNPLFIEELARAAGDLRLRGDLPESLHALLQARYDGLPPAMRQVLQQAAMVGRTFWAGAVDAQRSDEDRALQSTDKVLESLCDAGLVKHQEQNLYDGEEALRFAQNLMQEVAYASALRKDRRVRHGAVADWMVGRGDTPAPAHYPLLAAQLEGAGRNDEASRAWLRAANDARDRYANQTAAEDYGKALALQNDWATQERLHVMLNYGLSLEATGSLDAANDAYEVVGENEEADSTDRTLGLLYLGRLAGRSGQPAMQEDLQKRAFDVAQHADKRARLQVIADYGYALCRRGGHRQAEKLLDDALGTIVGEEHEPAMLVALANVHLVRGILQRNRGELVAAERSIRKGLVFFERAEHPSGRASTLTSLCVSLRELGQYENAAECAEKAARIFREAGHQGHEIIAALNLGWCYLEAGEYLKAKRVFQRVNDDTVGGLPRIQRIFHNAGDGLAAFGLNQLDTAHERADSCMGLIEDSVPLEDRGWALYAAGCIRNDVQLLLESADCWRQLERPAWLARTLDILIDLGVEDSTVIAERDQARATLAAAWTKMEQQTV